jgi:hypothetical protein
MKNRMKKILLFWIWLGMGSPVFAQVWRSSLYPENWVPGKIDSEGKFLHDFSYAGYHSGEVQLPEISNNIVDVTKSPYFADKTGNSNAQASIQKALDDVGKAGGGVVYLPEGTFQVNVSASAANPIKMTYSNVAMRGAGTDKTFIYNSNSNIRGLSVITVKPVTGGDWIYSGTNQVSVTEDLLTPTDIIPVSSVIGFKVGDWIVIRSDVTTAFMEEHQMGVLWTTSLAGPVFYRYIVSIDQTAHSLKVDAPTRYYLKKRDNARVYKVNPVLSEVGLENFSVGNKETIKSGLGDLDFDVAGTGAYEIHGSHLIGIFNALNCWVKNVNTYKPSQNSGDFHLVSNGIRLQGSRFVTVESCNFQKTQYKGEGGNGYLYILSANDCLISNSRANYGRHNYDFSRMQSNGNVILRCRGENSRLASDFHMHLSMANLFDNFTANKDFLEGKFRPYGTSPLHGYPTTQSVFWNTNGEAYPSGQSSIVESAQYGWGYIIGTRGPASAVKTSPFSGTMSGYAYNSSPEDFKEGIGKGDQLLPQSLYEDQLAKRILRNSQTANLPDMMNSTERISVYPNPSNSGLIHIESAIEINSYRVIDLTGKVVVKKSGNFGKKFGINITQKGLYIVLLEGMKKAYTVNVLVN